MAKQSGIHQIKGKIGEYSYYKSTGVQGGLIRSINQGLSERVKKSAEYANTRLNNQEFAAAANVAGLLGKMVVPKFRPMILPFSQSRMAKEILKVAREHTINWGQRVVTEDDTARLAEILSAQSKRDAKEFISVDLDRTAADSLDAIGEISSEQSTLMSSLGITNLTIRASLFDLATGQWVPFAQVMSTGYVNYKNNATVFDSENIIAGNAYESSETMSVEEFIPAPNHAAHQIVVFVIMPERTINNVTHILQEYCSFVAMPLPAVPQP